MGLFSKIKSNKKKSSWIDDITITPEYVEETRAEREEKFGKHTEVEPRMYILEAGTDKCKLVTRSEYHDVYNEGKRVNELGWNQMIDNLDSFVNESTKDMVIQCIDYINAEDDIGDPRFITSPTERAAAIREVFKNPLYFIIRNQSIGSGVPFSYINKDVINTIELFLSGKNLLRCDSRQTCKDFICLQLFIYAEIYNSEVKDLYISSFDMEKIDRLKYGLVPEVKEILANSVSLIQYYVIDSARRTSYLKKLLYQWGCIPSLYNDLVRYKPKSTDIVYISDVLFQSDFISSSVLTNALEYLQIICKEDCQIISTTIPNIESYDDCIVLQKYFNDVPRFETNWGIPLCILDTFKSGINIHICNEVEPTRYSPYYLGHNSMILLMGSKDKCDDDIMSELYSKEAMSDERIIQARNELVADLKMYFKFNTITSAQVLKYADPEINTKKYDIILDKKWDELWVEKYRTVAVEEYDRMYNSEASIINFTDGDMDGAGAAIIFKLTFGDDVNIVKTNRNVDTLFTAFLEGDYWKSYNKIYLTDISITEKVYKLCEEIDAKYDGQLFSKMHIWDHHSQATWLNNKQPGFKVETADWKDPDHPTSGTLLSFRMLVSKLRDNIEKQGWISGPSTYTAIENIVGGFAKDIRDYDTWEWFRNNDEYPNKLNNFFLISGWEVFVDDMFKRCVECLKKRNKLKMTSNQLYVANRYQMMVNRMVETKDKELIPVEVDGYKIGFIFLDSDQSTIGNVLAGRHPELDFIAMFTGSRFSFRSKTVDVSDFAFKHCGGGNGLTAGAPLHQDITDKMAQSILTELSFQHRE